MADDREIEEKFWEELKHSPFIMLGIEGARDGATQPMTANFEDQDRHPRPWIFTAKDHDFTRAMGQSTAASPHFRPRDTASLQACAGLCGSTTIRPRSSGCGARS